MAANAKLTVGDRQRSIRGTLRNADSSLATLTTVAFHMVHELGTIKVNYGAAVVESPGVARYDWGAADVNAAGVYYIWFRDTDAGGKTQHWPDGGRVYSIEFVATA
jgi:hypothetical protein